MNYCLRLFEKTFGTVQTDNRRQTERDVYEPTVQLAQVGSKIAIFLNKGDCKLNTYSIGMIEGSQNLGGKISQIFSPLFW